MPVTKGVRKRRVERNNFWKGRTKPANLRDQILMLLDLYPNLTNAEIGVATGRNYNTVASMLSSMYRKGQVARIKDGHYTKV